MKKFFAFHRQTQKQSRRKHFIKKQALLSLILICAFLFGALPPVSLVGSAVSLQPSQNRATEAQARVAAGFADPRELHDENALVVEEVTSLRDAYSKQYRLSNGEVAVYTYSDPLHFEKNGAWVDLDHTLTAQSGRFVNTSAPIQVSFAQSTADDSLFSFAYQNHSVDFSLMGVKQSSTSQTVLSLSANATAQLVSASSAEDGVIVSPQGANLVGKTAAEASSLRPGYTTSSIAYQAVSPGMDLTYTLSGLSARKEITLTSASAWKEPVFSMNTTLTPALSADGSIALSDTSGKEILTLPAPYMYDAAGEISTDVHYTLVSVKDFWLLSVTLDEEWLNAEERVFPVVVDPTVEVTGTSNVTDTMIREGSPTNTYNSMKYAVVGYSTTSSSKRNWGLYKMKTMPSIPSTAILTSATLKVRQLTSANGNYSWSNSAVESMQISAKMVLGSWAAAATWNARPAVDEAFPLDTKTLSASTAGQDFTFDIFDAYNAWHSGWYQFDTAVDNWGIQFSRHTDTGSSPNCYTSFYTSEHGTAANKPVFAVYYNTASATLSDDIYLFNNRYTGNFLRYNNSALSMQSGTMANLGSSVAWDVQYVGSYYVIESTAAPGTFLAASATSGSAAVETVSATATTVPTRAQWTITNAAGGGCLVKNAGNNRYLTVSGSSVQTTATLGSAGTEQYWRNTWRVPAVDVYVELGAFSIDNQTLYLPETDNITINQTPINASWTGTNDFELQWNNNHAQIDETTWEITPVSLGTTTFTVEHKPTGRTSTFTVTVTKIEIYVGMHHVAVGQNHTCVIVYAYPGSAYWDHAHFSPTITGKSVTDDGSRYATFGAGNPDDEHLISENNREKDIDLEIKLAQFPLGTVTPDVVDTLYELDANYGDDLKYTVAPLLFPGYNSNSYTSGLLEAAGFSVENIDVEDVPGWSTPVPETEFQSESQ